jgi:hypothetical protein
MGRMTNEIGRGINPAGRGARLLLALIPLDLDG